MAHRRIALAAVPDRSAGVRLFVRRADDDLIALCGRRTVRWYFDSRPPLGSRIAAIGKTRRSMPALTFGRCAPRVILSCRGTATGPRGTAWMNDPDSPFPHRIPKYKAPDFMRKEIELFLRARNERVVDAPQRRRRCADRPHVTGERCLRTCASRVRDQPPDSLIALLARLWRPFGKLRVIREHGRPRAHATA